MLWTLLEIICVAVAAVGLLMVFIQVRTGFDRSLLLFGITLFMLCTLAGVDIWIQPYHERIADRLPWLKFQHVIFCAFVPVMYAYLLRLAKIQAPRIVRIAACVTPLLAASFIFGDLMLTLDGDLLAAGPLYLPVFIPTFIAFVAIALHLMRLGLRRADPAERRLLKYHLWGFAALSLTGLVDLITIYAIPNYPLPSFVIAGVLVYGAVTATAFTERLIQLINDRRQAYLKLEGAYKDLETANALGELGRSAGLINHELRNHLFRIAGSVELVLGSERLSDAARQRLRSVADTVGKLDRFSRDVVALSRSRALPAKRSVRLAQVVGACALRLGPERAEQVVLHDVPEQLGVDGDWSKLEQMFLDLFTNAFEAGASQVSIEAVAGPAATLVKVEDDGVGCSADQLDEVFRAFYTTKSDHAGAGLGLSVVRAIVEAHGGHVSAYTKNRPGSHEHGMVFMLTFPPPGPAACDGEPQTPGVVLVADGLPDFFRVIRVFQNARVCPRVVDTLAEAGTVHTPDPEVAVIGQLDDNDAPISAGFPRFGAIHRITAADGMLFAYDAREGIRRAFTEEYVLSELVRPQAA